MKFVSRVLIKTTPYEEINLVELGFSPVNHEIELDADQQVLRLFKWIYS